MPLGKRPSMLMEPRPQPDMPDPSPGEAPVQKIIAPVARYTKLVRFGRNVLWLLIACIVGSVVWIASRDPEESGARLVFSNVEKTESLQDMMVNPRFQGLDARNNPYTVIAERAVQKDKQTVSLDQIRADMMQKDGAWLALHAGSGELDLESKEMVLFDTVTMFYEGGYEFQTAYAQVDIGKGEAYGDAPVEGQGPAGTLKADSFVVKDRGRVIRFNGSVRMTLYP